MMTIPVLRGYPPSGALVGRKEALPNYVESYDATVRVLKKVLGEHPEQEALAAFKDALDAQDEKEFIDRSYLFATPCQLCVAALAVAAKRKEAK